MGNRAAYGGWVGKFHCSPQPETHFVGVVHEIEINVGGFGGRWDVRCKCSDHGVPRWSACVLWSVEGQSRARVDEVGIISECLTVELEDLLPALSDITVGGMCG
jgi:hypothetical protein